MQQLTPHQYKPFTHTINGIPLIIYAVKNNNDLHDIAPTQQAVCNYLDMVYKANSERLERGLYHIIFTWNRAGLFMTDVWIHQQNMSDAVAGKTTLEACVVFKGTQPYVAAGIASENTLVTLGREQEHAWRSATLESYLNRHESMPDFPEGYAPEEVY